MKREIYYSKRSFSKYDDSHYIVYLNEEVLENFVPETFEGDKAPEPQIAYAYTGPEEDGGTLIEAKSATYDEFVSGLVRLEFPQAKVEAILLNQGDGNDEHLAEYNNLQFYRRECKLFASKLLAD